MLRLNQIIQQFSTKSQYFWNSINSNVAEAEYAVRGVVPTLANTIKEEIDKGSKAYPFKEVTFCNIGNPQEFHQKPITFYREVLACMLNPSLINNQHTNIDAAKRAEGYLKQIISAGSYTHSLGIPLVRRSVAKYISREDGVNLPDIDDIYMTEGASQGVHLILNCLITDRNDGIMIPIPQYPLYSATISLYGGSAVPYYLNEQKGWQLDLQQLQKSIQQARKNGKNVKCIVVINPGNPTGAIFNAETIQQIIQFSVKNKLILIADEVYRQNIYKENAVFVSFRKILNQMPTNIQQECQLASLHSVSKGLLGECGLRGGYLYLHNFNPKVKQQMVKLKSINLCSNSVGQATVELMCNPPLEGVSDTTKNTFLAERDALLKSLKKRALNVTKYLRSMQNVTTNEVEGAMYAFPSIKFSNKAIQAAKAEGKSPDLFYCLEVLKNTGIALAKPGTYHFRITTLILPQQKLQQKLSELKKFNDAFHQKYA